MSRPSILEQLRALPSRPSPADLEPVAEALAAKAAQRRFPLKSAAATLRTHRRPAQLGAATVGRLLERTAALLAARTPAQAAADDAEWCGEERAAAIAGVRVDELRTLMIDPVQRRLHGCPYWNGREWRFPLAALRTATRTTFLAALPDRDPCEDLLPPWCRRSTPVGDEGSSDPGPPSSRAFGGSRG